LCSARKDTRPYTYASPHLVAPAHSRRQSDLAVPETIAIIGGGAAGFFAAIACAPANPANEVSIYERGSEFLTKVRISGGGRCNVTRAANAFELHFAAGETAICDRLLLSTGGTRSMSGERIARALGHTLLPAVPSLFSFHVAVPWLRLLPGVSVQNVEASVPGTRLRECGALLITHNGVCGHAILRLSAWGSWILHALYYE